MPIYSGRRKPWRGLQREGGRKWSDWRRGREFKNSIQERVNIPFHGCCRRRVREGELPREKNWVDTRFIACADSTYY